MARKPQISFYANGHYVVLPFASYSDIIQFAKNKGATLLAVDERYITSTRPELSHLLSENDNINGLNLIYKDNKINGQKQLIYELENN